MIFTNKTSNTLLILSIDDYGYDLFKRGLFSKSKFKILLEDKYHPLTITLEELHRLVIYGSCEEDYESIKRENLDLKARLYEFQQQRAEYNLFMRPQKKPLKGVL